MRRLKMLWHIIQVTGFTRFALSFVTFVFGSKKENRDALDEVMWNSIADIKFNVMKDTLTKKSLFTQIKEALEVKDYARASNLQLELKANMEEIQQLYVRYKKNIY